MQIKKSLWQEFHLSSMYIFSVPFFPQKIGFLPPHHGELSDVQASRLLQSHASCLKIDLISG